jgi:predicted ferric reductase
VEGEMIELIEMLNYVFSFLNAKTNTLWFFVIANTFTAICLSYVAISVHTFKPFHRLGFVFIIIGLFHGVLLRLVVLGYLDPFLLIDVSSILGLVLIQAGLFLVAFQYLIASIFNHYIKKNVAKG